jgi:NADH:ubiquinone oxidoreductase subunit K
MRKGTKAVVVVMLATAVVLIPLVLGGVFLGFYVGDAVGYSKSVMAIAFSTAGFIAGIAILFKVIRAVAGTSKP